MRSRNQHCLALILATALCAPARPALADTGNEAIDKGIALYDDLEFEQAIVVLGEALEQSDLSTEELTEGYRHLALAHLALGQDEKAKEAFRMLLVANPRYELSRTTSQKARDLFDEVKRSLPPPPEEVKPVRLTQTVSPLAPKKQTPVSISVIVVDPDKRHQRVVVYHRIKGQKKYSRIVAMHTAQGRYAATISGAFVEPPALEYYVAAVDADGNDLAVEGSAQRPLTLTVEKKEKAAAPIYARWWFWGAIGAVAATSVAIIALSGGGDSPDPDATVTITVDYP